MGNCILFVDTRMRISVSNPNVMNRHIRYLDALRKLDPSGDWSLVILHPRIGASFSLVETSTNIFEFLAPSYKPSNLIEFLISSSIIPKVLVCGDPWESFFLSMFIKFKNKHRFKLGIQVQVHSELSRAWGKLSKINWLRLRTAYFGLKYADRIRATSTEHALFLSKRFNIQIEKFDSIPVLMKLEKPGENNLIRSRKDNVIGFVGRIHKERDLDGFVRIIKEITKQVKNVSVVVIGDGEDRCDFLRNLRSIKDLKIEYLGELSMQEMALAWSAIDVLISSSKTESFGRAIRESLNYGVPVLAYRSSGAVALKQQFPKFVELYSEDTVGSQVIEKFKKILDIRVDPEVGEILRQKDEQVSRDLAIAWLSMARQTN